MAVSKSFKATIEKYLLAHCEKEPAFKKKMDREDKNLDDCCTYILNQVKDSKAEGFTDSEIYGMALHYYDEDKIDIGKAIDMQVKVNHHVELTEEEREELVQKARQEVIDEEKKRMRTKKKRKVTPEQNVKQAKDSTAQERLF